MVGIWKALPADMVEEAPIVAFNGESVKYVVEQNVQGFGEVASGWKLGESQHNGLNWFFCSVFAP